MTKAPTNRQPSSSCFVLCPVQARTLTESRSRRKEDAAGLPASSERNRRLGLGSTTPPQRLSSSAYAAKDYDKSLTLPVLVPAEDI